MYGSIMRKENVLKVLQVKVLDAETSKWFQIYLNTLKNCFFFILLDFCMKKCFKDDQDCY